MACASGRCSKRDAFAGASNDVFFAPGARRSTPAGVEVEGWAAVSEIWNSVAPGWEANAGFVDEQLALATETLLDATRVGEGDRVLDLAAGPGGAGLAAAQRVGPAGSVVLSDVAAEMVAVAAKRASAYARVSTAVFGQSEIDFGDASFDAVINRHGLMFVEDRARRHDLRRRGARRGGWRDDRIRRRRRQSNTLDHFPHCQQRRRVQDPIA